MSVWTTAGLIADGSFDDPANARVIYLAVAGLVVLAALLGVGTWLWWRSSKVENPVLAPLEVMGSRRWWRSDFNERQRRIESVRPAHTEGDPDDADMVVAPEQIDLDHVLSRDDPHTFDDLVDPDAVPAAAEAAEVAAVDVAAAEAAAAADASDAAVAAEAEAIVVEAAPGVEAELAAEAVAVVEVEPVAVVEVEPVAVVEVEPVAVVEAELVDDVVLEPAVRSIVIDTAPRPRDTPSDLGPEAVDTDPTPVPIDPLLRLQSE